MANEYAEKWRERSKRVSNKRMLQYEGGWDAVLRGVIGAVGRTPHLGKGRAQVASPASPASPAFQGFSLSA